MPNTITLRQARAIVTDPAQAHSKLMRRLAWATLKTAQGCPVIQSRLPKGAA